MFSMWSLVLTMPVTKIADFDLFFHLRLGKELMENLGLYRTDTFTYTVYGKSQNLLEWLSNGILFLVFKLSGYYGLGILKAVMLGMIAFFALRSFKALRPSASLSWAHAAALVVMVYAMRFRLDLRPYYFTYLSLAVFMYAFYRFRAEGKANALYLLIPVQVLWSNTHGGMIMGPCLAALFLLTESLRTRKFQRDLLLPVVFIFAASGLNPEGFRPLRMLVSFAPGGQTGLSAIGEWQGLGPDLLWGYGLRYTLGFQVLALGAFLWLFMEALKKRFDFFLILVFAGSVFYSFRHVRLIDVSSVVLAPLFFLLAVKVLERMKRYETALNLCAAAFIVYLLVFSVFLSSTYSFGFGKKQGVFPDGALGFLDETRIGGNAFNTITVGSYMLWASPERKVFIDGRLIVPRQVREGYRRAIDGAEGFEELDSIYGFNYALIDYDPKYRWRFPLHLSGSPLWVPVYWDRCSVLYLKRSPENSDIIKKYGYELLRPSFEDFTYLDLYMKSRGMDDILAATGRDIARNPSLQDAHLAKAYVSYYYGRKDTALEALRTSLSLMPDTPFEHVAVSQLYIETGDTASARRHLKRALELEPRNKKARTLIELIEKGR